MTAVQTRTADTAQATTEMKLEVVVLPVADVERAKDFYGSLGWRLDADFATSDEFRVVQFTPPGSSASVIFGKGVTSATPGSVEDLQLTVFDIDKARDELVDRGVDVSEVFHDAGGVFHHAGTGARVSGPAPDHADYGSFASFRDPDGNGWLLQEIKVRLPGRETTTTAAPAQRDPELLGQTVVVIGGSAGIGLETARRARAEGAEVIITGRNAERLEGAAQALGALSTAAFDAADPAALEAFFESLPDQIDHLMVTAGGPYYAPLADFDIAGAARSFDEHLWLAVRIAQLAAGKVRPGGSLIFISGTGGRRPGVGLGAISTASAGMPALIANLALESAPIRVNLIAPGFVDTPLSASLLGDGLEARREQLRATLPIGRVVGPADVAALATHLMSNTALTGATYDVDGGQQLI